MHVLAPICFWNSWPFLIGPGSVGTGPGHGPDKHEHIRQRCASGGVLVKLDNLMGAALVCLEFPNHPKRFHPFYG
jgi:hypothetical protein